MRLFTAFSAGLLALSVSALPSFTTASQVAVREDDLKIPGDNPLKLCSKPEDWILDLQNVDLSSNPPKPGKNLTVTAKGILSETVEEGATVHLLVKYNGVIPIFKQTLDLCNTVKNVNLDCPIEKGEIEITKDVEIPQQIPPGKYAVNADVFTHDEKRITCLNAVVEFPRGGSLAGVFKQGL